MFLKKKNPGIDAVNPEDPDDKRTAFRYVFSPDFGLCLVFKKKAVTLVNISAGGLAFENQDFFPGDTDQIQLSLDIPGFAEPAIFHVQTRIFHISRDGVCHCSFDALDPDQAELIHKYVLEMQKRELRHGA